jgi:hypothetical protein
MQRSHGAMSEEPPHPRSARPLPKESEKQRAGRVRPAAGKPSPHPPVVRLLRCESWSQGWLNTTARMIVTPM